MSDRSRHPMFATNAARVCLAAVVTFAVMRIALVDGLLNHAGEQNLTPVWPASGVNIAMMLLLGWRIWPGIFLGSFVCNLVVYDFGWTAALLAPIADTFEPLIAFWIVRRYITGPPLRTTFNVCKFILGSALFAPAAAALIGVSVLLMVPDFIKQDEVFRQWFTWFSSASIGVLVMSPILLAWRRYHVPPWTKRAILQGGWIGVLLTGVLFGLFIRPISTAWLRPEPLLFLTIPPIVWASYSFSALGGGVVMFITTMTAVIGTINGVGPFASGRDTAEALVLLQLYLSVVAIMSMLLGASAAERAEAYRILRRRSAFDRVLLDELNHRVRNNLSTILSLIKISEGGADDMSSFSKSIEGRVQNLARVHSLLSERRWTSVRLSDLLTDILDDELLSRVRIRQTNENNAKQIVVPSQQAAALSMVLHELETSSKRNGALSTNDGRVEIDLSDELAPDGSTKVSMSWREIAEPSSDREPPQASVELISAIVRSDLRGSADMTNEPKPGEYRFCFTFLPEESEDTSRSFEQLLETE